MSLPSPCLDDRTFDQLVDEARELLHRSCPEWTDASPSDPGMVLVELFAHLTDQLIYRLNRLPDKVYVEFLRLMGVHLIPPGAAQARLTFSRSKPGSAPLEIPRGTRITTERADAGREAPVFTTLRAAVIPAGAAEVVVEAVHCRLVEGEDAGLSSGEPGQVVVARHAPLIAPTGDALDLLVGVEAAPGELAAGEEGIRHGDVDYRVWREADDFTGHAPGAPVYLADRMSGEIIFAPAARLRDAGGRLKPVAEALAGVPPAKRRIRLWYRHGGGPEGNVAPGRLTVLKDPIPGVTVTNPEAALGGCAAESVDNALERGPFEFYSLKRAVTAFDYELIACRSGAVSRAKAFASAELHRYAQPGTVAVLLVPSPGQDDAANERLDAAGLRALQSEEARADVAEALDGCRPLGSACVVGWARCKAVQVRMRVVVQNQLDTDAVKVEILRSLRRRINPLPLAPYPGWGFGEALRASHLYDLVLGRPGVGYVDRLALAVEDVPDSRVAALAADAFQPRTWYAAAADRLFVSEDDGDGWQPLGQFANERIALVAPHPAVPGLLAAVARVEDGAHVLTSRDGGQTWASRARTDFTIADLAWAQRGGSAVMFLATDVGLYELAEEDGAVPVQVLVDPAKQDLGFFAVAITAERGEMTVAVAAETLGGVFVSSQGGKTGTFRTIGLSGEDVRVLAVRRDGPRAFLWAGLAAVGNENGKGCLCYELRNDGGAGPEGWRWANKGWNGGSVHALAFSGQRVIAASHRSGVLVFDSATQDPAWQAPAVDCGLPLRDAGRLHPVEALAVDPRGEVLLAGGIQGVFRAQREHTRFSCCSCREFTDKVTLPETWMFLSGDHQVEVVTYDDVRAGAEP